MNNIKDSLQFFKNTKNKLSLITFMYLILGVISFITPILTANLLAGLIYTDLNLVIDYAIYVAVAFILQEIILYITEYIWNVKIRPRILFNIRHFIINNILRLKMTVIDEYGEGSIEEKIDSEPNEIAKIVNTAQRNIINVITKIGIIIYIILTEWRISLIYIIGMLIVAYIDTKKQKVVKLKDMKLSNSESSSSKFIDEVVEGMGDIKTLNIEEKIGSHLSNKLNTVANNISEKDLLESRYAKLEKVVLYITTALVMIIGMIFLRQSNVSVVNLLIMYLYQNDVFSLMSEISILRSSIKDYNVIMTRILQLDNDKKYEKENFGKKELKNVKGKINFNNVVFGYTKTNPIIKNMTFEIKPGETVALVGSAECGKSTILKLLARKHDCQTGTITIDDTPIEELTEDTLKSNISVVNQDSYIFNMSIKDNLLLVKPNATKKEIDNVCQKVKIYDYIMSLPDKYNTIIGKDGINLSGGQRQKLAIARALLQGSKILLFDEATSMIDNNSQAEIQEAIEEITRDLTVIIVSHRLSATSKCDRIMVIDKGKVVAEGNHKNLVTNCKVYRNLYKDINKKIRL